MNRYELPDDTAESHEFAYKAVIDGNAVFVTDDAEDLQEAILDAEFIASVMIGSDPEYCDNGLDVEIYVLEDLNGIDGERDNTEETLVLKSKVSLKDGFVVRERTKCLG